MSTPSAPRPLPCGPLVLALLVVPAGELWARGPAPEPGSVCELARPTRLRPQPKARPRGRRLRPGAQVEVVAAAGAWLRVRPANGHAGFVRRVLVARCRPPPEKEQEQTGDDDAFAAAAVAQEPASASGQPPAPTPADLAGAAPTAGTSTPGAAGAGPARDPLLAPDSTTPAARVSRRGESQKRRRAPTGQLEARYQHLFVPPALLEIFWSRYQPVSGYAVSAAYSLLADSGFNLTLSLSYGEITAPDGPWHGRDDEDSDPDWSIVDLRFVCGLVTAGYDLELVGPVSVVIGTGLGVARAWGDLVSYNSPTGATGTIKKRDYPPLLPVVHVQISPRLVLWQRLVMQIDVGVSTGFYAGGSAGLRW